MLKVQPRFLLLALPWAGLHGGQYARTIERRLRQVRGTHRNPQRMADDSTADTTQLDLS
jgi:hypothetical protein